MVQKYCNRIKKYKLEMTVEYSNFSRKSFHSNMPTNEQLCYHKL